MNKITNLKIWLVISLLLLGMVSKGAGQTIFVDTNATGANDGSSWEDAFNYLQDALAVAASRDEVRVTDGIYRPDEDTTDPEGTGDRSATFQLVNSVTIKGGFAGFGADNPDECDPYAYETILSGDLAGNDAPGEWDNYAENSYHVVTADNTDNSAVLDGFTITAGNSTIKEGPLTDALGGGLIARSGSPTVTNCFFRKNRCLDRESFGGGMYVGTGDPYVTYDGNPIITNCVFAGNLSACGGGLFVCVTDARVIDCMFSDNYATSDGGGIDSYGNITVTNSIITGNRTGGGYGGGIHAYSVEGAGTVAITNCVISDNSSPYKAGGLNINGESLTVARITNCTFTGNQAGISANGILNRQNANTTVTNCILWDGGDEIEIESGSVTVNFSDVQGGWSGVGTNNIDADPLFVDPANGDYHLLPDSDCIDAGNNSAVPPGIATDLDGNPRIVNTIVDMGAFEAPWPIERILDFIEDSVDANTLEPVKEGKPGQGQLGALINMIEAAGNLIDAELLADACWQLKDALEKTDGLAPPESAPDFVTGVSAPELAGMIEVLMESLGCE